MACNFPAKTLLFFSLIFLCSSENSQLKFYREVPKELRCNGCEQTVKLLNQMLIDNKIKDVTFRVDQVLLAICDIERYRMSEYKVESLVKVCEYMTESHGKELREELIKHYSVAKRSTYLEFVKHICMDVMKLCAGVTHKWQDKEDTVLHFDADSHEFTVMPGKNIRLPKPVKELHHDEL